MHEKTRKLLTGVAALAAAGGATAGIATAARDDQPDHRMGRMGGPGVDHQRGPHHGTVLTGDAKEQAEAAAKAKLPDATVRESFEGTPPGIDGARYVVHVEKADGTPAAVVLDAEFAVLEVLDAPARGRGMHPRPEQLTGDAAEKAKAAAKEAVPNGTVRAAFAAPEGKADGAAYVVIVERKAGRHVIVLLDEQFDVVRKLTQPRFGHGPGPGFRHHGGPPSGMPA